MRTCQKHHSDDKQTGICWFHSEHWYIGSTICDMVVDGLAHTKQYNVYIALTDVSFNTQISTADSWMPFGESSETWGLNLHWLQACVLQSHTWQHGVTIGQCGIYLKQLN